MDEKKLGLRSVISTSVGLVIATSCLVSLGQGAGEVGVVFIGAMVIACLLNLTTIGSLSELNALMPNITGGLAQYTLACIGPLPTIVSMVGGYLLCNILSAGVEASIFAYAMSQVIPLPIPSIVYTAVMMVFIMVANLYGVDMFAKVQDLVAFLLVGSMVIMGLIGVFKLGTGQVVTQAANNATSPAQVISMTAVAFWLFIGAEFAIPISGEVKNAKRNVPLGMALGLVIILIMQSILVIGFYHYTPWDALMSSAAPHLLYGEALLGKGGKIWMAFVAALAVVSTQNSGVNGLAHIGQGMAKMNMLPQVFAKTNKRGVPYIGVIVISVAMFLFAYVSDGSSDLILVGSVFWMITYIFAHIDVLILRKKLPKAPRSFKLPCGPLFPIIGILGTSYMILYISTDPRERLMIWVITGVTMLVLGIYAYFWTKYKMKMPVWKAVPIEKVMAMDNELYFALRKKLGIW